MDAAARRSFAAQAAVGLASFLTPFLYGALSVAIPTIGHEFSFTAQDMVLVMMAHLLFSTGCNLPFSRLSDKVGRKNVFMAGSLLFAASSLMAALAHGKWFLLAARALQGVGDAMTFGVSAAILVSIVPPERTGRALGVNVTFIYAGLALGPLVGGALTSWLSWRVIFFASAAAGVAAMLLIHKGFSEQKARVHTPVDVRGIALYLPAILALILGISQTPSWSGTSLIVLSLVLFAWFRRVELRQEHPLVDLAYLRGNRAFTLANLTSTLGFTAGFSMGFLASLLLQNVMGLPAKDAGALLLVQPAVLTLMSPLAGRLSDRFMPEKVSAFGLGLMGTGLIAFSLHGLAVGPAWVVALLAVVGFGFALFVSPNINAIMRSIDTPHMGLASGLLATMRGLGMCMSLSLTGVVLAVYGVGAQATQAGPEIVNALGACFFLFGAVSLAAALVSMRTARQ
jgi:MFS family permease